MFPNEYPGMDYHFNWSLNGDGVTPLKRLAFRLTKPLDLKIAGLEQPSSNPLQVKPAPASKMPEAGVSDALTFEAFDEVSQRTKDLLSLSKALYCPEGHVPGSKTVGVRVITNSPTLAPSLVAYLDRAPKREPDSQAITVYLLEGTDEEFAGYAIEEVEKEAGIATSVAAVVVVGKAPSMNVIAAGIQQSFAGLEADEAERAAKKAAEDKQQADE